MKKTLIFLTALALVIFTGVCRAGNVACYTVWKSQSVAPGGYVESGVIALSPVVPSNVQYVWKTNTDGFFSFQPAVSSGTFTFTVYFSNFSDPEGHWDSGTTIATGVTSSDTDPVNIDPNGPHLWMKIRATETGGSGSPSLSASLCTD